MKGSKTVVLLLLVLGFGAYIWFYEMNQMSTAEKKVLERQAFDVQVEQINGIGIRTPDYEVDLVKTEQGWELLHPKGARAALPVVHQLLARFKTLYKGELITPADIRAKEQSLAEYGLSVPHIKLTLKTPGQTRKYEVGDKNPLGNSVYVKEDATQNVMLVSTDLLDVLPTDLLVFRDKTLFPLHEEEVQALDLISKDRTLRLEKRNEQWVIKTPVNALADQAQVNALVKKLLQATIDGAINDPGKEDEVSFKRSQEVIRMWANNSKVPVEVVVGGDLPMNPDQLLLRITGQEGLVKVSKGMRVLAQSPVALLRDRSLYTEDPQTVTAISIQRDGQSLRLEKTGTDWWVMDPVNMKASSARVQNMIKTWRDARVEKFLGEDGGEKALTEVMFTSLKSGNPVQTNFGVLSTTGIPGRVRLRKAGESGLLQVVPDLVKYSPVDVLPYLSREVLSFDPVKAVRLSLTRDGKSTGVTRTDAGQPWVAQDGEGDVDQEKIIAILNSFSNIFAENLVELNPADPAKYGLDQPQIRLSIGLAGEQAGNRTLLLNQQEPNGPVLGILQGQNLVFQLSLGDFERVQSPLTTAK